MGSRASRLISSICHQPAESVGLCISLAAIDMLKSRCWSQESMQTAVEHNEASAAAELLTMLRETVEQVSLSPLFSPWPSAASWASCAWPMRVYNSAEPRRLRLCGLQAGLDFRLDEGQCLCLLDCAAHSANRGLAQAAWQVLQASIQPGNPGPRSISLQNVKQNGVAVSPSQAEDVWYFKFGPSSPSAMHKSLERPNRGFVSVLA